MSWTSILKSDSDIRTDLEKNILLCGGNTMYEGLPERLKSEIVSLAPAGCNIKVIAPADRKYAVWLGASRLASLSTFGSSWVTADEYQEHGAAVIHRKCN